jgi:hypothetical protein
MDIHGQFKYLFGVQFMICYCQSKTCQGQKSHNVQTVGEKHDRTHPNTSEHDPHPNKLGVTLRISHSSLQTWLVLLLAAEVYQGTQCLEISAAGCTDARQLRPSIAVPLRILHLQWEQQILRNGMKNCQSETRKQTLDSIWFNDSTCHQIIQNSTIFDWNHLKPMVT